MTRPLILATFFTAVGLTAAPLWADRVSKDQDCAYQGDVVSAIQTARLDRVSENKLLEAISATNPEWPERYNAAITILAGPIYDLKRRDLKKVDLGAQWKEACLAQG